MVGNLVVTAVVFKAAVTFVVFPVVTVLSWPGASVGSIQMIVTLFPWVHLVLTISTIYSSPSSWSCLSMVISQVSSPLDIVKLHPFVPQTTLSQCLMRCPSTECYFWWRSDSPDWEGPLNFCFCYDLRWNRNANLIIVLGLFSRFLSSLSAFNILLDCTWACCSFTNVHCCSCHVNVIVLLLF